MAWLDQVSASGAPLRRMGPGIIAVTDPELAGEILENKEANYVDQADFFGSRDGKDIGRSCQLRIRRLGREFLARAIDAASPMPELVPSGEIERWPEAGNRLVERLMRSALMHTGRSHEFSEARESILDTRIFSPRTMNLISKIRRKRQFLEAVSSERRLFERESVYEPKDILDVLFINGAGLSDAKIMEIYIAFNFSVVGSVGFTLSWIILLALKNRVHETNFRFLALEALRLYPIAWFLSRRSAGEHVIDSEFVSKGDHIWIFPYAIHRRSDLWEAPTSFLPERWRNLDLNRHLYPFGAGAHRCVAEALTLRLLEGFYGALGISSRCRLLRANDKPRLGVALAPPDFTFIR